MMIAPSLRRFLNVPRHEPVACNVSSTSRMTRVASGSGKALNTLTGFPTISLRS